ncbi:MAG: T9SS type A sorting domain-containing protein [Planctomycetia bacterium]|nr:T9SS type A sorting domain-containing protein [Planctomycetia bacterium]
MSVSYSQTNVACVGNSITWGSKLSDPATESYPSRLAVLLGNDYVVKNFGEPGATLLHNTWKPYFETTTHSNSIAIPHDIVIILLGTNDSDETNWVEKAHFKEDYYDLINDYKNYPGSEDPIFILGLPPPVFDESAGHRNAPIVDEIIPMIKQVADSLDLTIADFYNALDGKPELFIDGVHPNGVGTEIMAEVAYEAIQEAITTTYPPPDIPTGLKTIPGEFNINLEWHANIEDDLFSYNIYRSFEKGGVQDYIGITIQPDTTFSDNNVLLNHIYYYSIDAKNVNNVASGRTAAIAGKTLDHEPPSAPLSLQAFLDADSVKISWIPNTEPDIEKYYIYRNTIVNEIQQSSSIVGTVYAPDSNFNDLTFDSATNYYYGLKAVDISGNQGLISNIVNITTKSRPVSSDTILTFYEDVPRHFSVSDFPFSDADNHSLQKIMFINTEQGEYFTYNADSIENTKIYDDISKLVFKSNLDEFGDNYAAFTFRVIDSFGSASSDTNSIIINVASVNDAPHIDPISDLYIMEDSLNILIPLSGINAGPTNELQNLSVKAFADDTTLVKVTNIQYGSPGDTGLVIINPIENVYGIIPMTVQVLDDGGILNGGIDTSETTFFINISPINDPPIFNLLDSIQIFEDSETIIALTGVQAGPWEKDQQITMSVKSNNTDILPNPALSYNSPDTIATLTFSTIPNIFGSASISITMSDNGGTNFGGKDSISYLIPVEITSVNDKPSDFNIITPSNDSTIVINKSNYLNTFAISWEMASDIENDDIVYDIIFNGDLSTLSRYGLNSTKTEYVLREILAVTDTVSIVKSTYNIIAFDGYLQTAAINNGFTITIDGRSFAPAKLNLDQNYPNPFNQSTLIGFDLPKRTNVSVIIYDLLGEEIIKLIDNKKYERGYNTVMWNGLDKNNNIVTAGIYLMQIRMGSQEQHKKLIFLK